MAETKSKGKAKPQSPATSQVKAKPKTVATPKSVVTPKVQVKPRTATITKTETKSKTSAPATGITFKCRLCEKQKPITDMKILKRFRPVIFVCIECEKTIQ
jgi:hypothetical protein